MSRSRRTETSCERRNSILTRGTKNVVPSELVGVWPEVIDMNLHQIAHGRFFTAIDDELALDRFKGYQHLWEQEGVYVMLTRFIADYKVKQVLINEAAENGERIITNVLQLMELLHKTQTQKQFSMPELVNWLKRGIEGMQVEGDEFEQRVESDEESVKIVTIHKSKGLEYNIVFAPFLDLTSDTDFEFVTFRDAVSGDYLFSDTSLLDDYQLRVTEKQLEQENRRLVYVAITRAVYKCYISKNTWRTFNNSSISRRCKTGHAARPYGHGSSRRDE